MWRSSKAVGAATEVELKEKQAPHRGRRAQREGGRREGIVAGGGVALLEASDRVREAGPRGRGRRGANIVKVAVEAPLKQIAVNAGRGRRGGGRSPPSDPGYGLNAATGEYVDLIDARIIDPAKVTRSALQNAASIAALFLTTEAVVADKPEKAAPVARVPATWAAWTSVRHRAARADPPGSAPRCGVCDANVANQLNNNAHLQRSSHETTSVDHRRNAASFRSGTGSLGISGWAWAIRSEGDGNLAGS